MANPENKQLPYESTQKDIRDGIDGASAKLTTTELTPRNLADVLAEEIKALTTVVGGLNFINCVVVAQLPTTGISTTTIYLVPKSPSQQDNIYDEYINLDGTVNGWEKIGDTEIDLSNYYTKSDTDTLLSDKVDKVNGKGLSTNDFTDTEKAKLAGIEAGAEVNPTSSAKTATESFETVDGGLLQKCAVDLEPVQDLHGYDKPWVGGAGKNKAQDPKTGVYSATTGEWSGGDVYAHSIAKVNSNTTYTMSVGNVGNVSVLLYYNDNPSSTPQNYFISAESVGAVSTYTFTTPSTAQYVIYETGSNATPRTKDNVGFIQIELGSTATAYEPYSNICPISGHTQVDVDVMGKNLFDETYPSISQSIRYKAINVGEGTFTLKTNAPRYDNSGCAVFLLSGNVSSGATNNDHGAYDGNPRTQTATDGYVTVAYRTISDIDPLNYDVFLYDNATRETYVINLGGTYYNGTLDVVSGELTITHANVDLGSITWSHRSGDVEQGVFSGDITPHYNAISTLDIRMSCYSKWNMFNATGEMVSAPDGSFGYYSNRNGMSWFLAIKDKRYSDVTTFTTAVTGQTVCYELATPTTIQLSPTIVKALVGENHLSTPLDGQSIDSVEYREVFAFDDVEKVVSLRVPISMLGTDESGNTTASRAYTTGEFFYKDGKMHKVLTNIASGATFTVGTNISETTLFAELTALA